jgi:hypothetical protein
MQPGQSHIVRTTVLSVLGTAPVSLGTAKQQLRVTEASDDALITSFINTAVGIVEDLTFRCIVKKQYKATLDGYFAGQIPWWDGVQEASITIFQQKTFRLPRPPLISVDAINVFDDSDVATLCSPSIYFVDMSSEDLPARIVLRRGQVWPVALRVANQMEITFTAGYNDGTVPAKLQTAILLVTSWLYQNRGDYSDTASVAAMSGAMPFINAEKVMSFT